MLCNVDAVYGLDPAAGYVAVLPARTGADAQRHQRRTSVSTAAARWQSLPRQPQQ